MNSLGIVILVKLIAKKFADVDCNYYYKLFYNHNRLRDVVKRVVTNLISNDYYYLYATSYF